MIHAGAGDAAMQLIDQMTVASRDQALAHLKQMSPRDAGVPNIYRVKAQGGRWQCEWDDLTEIGAFRSRWLGRAVTRAQVARVRFLIRTLDEGNRP